jgi:hypothetical protein
MSADHTTGEDSYVIFEGGERMYIMRASSDRGGEWGSSTEREGARYSPVFHKSQVESGDDKGQRRTPPAELHVAGSAGGGIFV